MDIEGIAKLAMTDIYRTLYDVTSFQREFDRNLCEALDTILTGLQAKFVLARFGDHESAIVYCPFNFEDQIFADQQFHKMDAAFCEASKQENKSRVYHAVLGGVDNIVGVDLLLDIKDEYGKEILVKDVANYCIFGEKLDLMDLAFRPYTGKVLNTIIEVAYALNYAFRYRKSLFKHFPERFVKEYWMSSCQKLVARPPLPSRQRLHIAPPWTDDGLRRTATLSFDMRKSTFAMDLSTDQKAYADWIEAFVLILQRLAKENDGVFDKFTGDGALVHFLADECRRFEILTSADEERLKGAARWRTEASSTGQIATRQALRAGWEMIYGIERHMSRLDEILGMGNAKIGPAVGIAIERAQWSVDRDGNLIVVGRGVVEACRITADTPASHMCLTRHALQMAQEVHGKFPYSKCPFVSKEHQEDAGVEIFQLDVAPEHLCRPRADIAKIVEEIWEDMDRRSAGRGPINVG